MKPTSTTKSASTSETPKSGPDVKEMSGRDLPKSTFPGRGTQAFRVFLDKKVHGEIAKHAGEDVGVEICGVLVGGWKTDEDGPYVEINASIPGEAVANKLSEVTFTHETWAKIHKRMDADFSDRSIIGWYHTHPNFGIFLSDRDCFIHEHFFREPGQVAYVVDPVRKEEGFFIWSKGKPVPAEHYWVGSELRDAPPIEGDKREGRDRSMRDRAPSSGPADAQRKPSGERGSDQGEMLPPGWISQTLFGLCLFLLGYMLSSFFTNQQERAAESMLTKYAVMKGFKPGLGPSLEILRAQINSLSQGTQGVADIAGLSTEQKANWLNVTSKLKEFQKEVEGLHAVYALNRQDEAAVESLNLGWLPKVQKDPAATQAATKPVALSDASTQPASTQPSTPQIGTAGK